MSEYIVRYVSKHMLDEGVFEKAEEIVRCRDCEYGRAGDWSGTDIPDDWLNCRGPLVELWDYYDDKPNVNPVRPDGFCAWGERRGDVE